MEHQAFAELLGNYGEFVGAIGVVITLVYLAIQIRQNTQTMKSTALRSMQDVVLLTDHNERYIGYVMKELRGEPLTDEERAHMVERFLTIMRTMERIWFEYRLGLLPRNMFEQHLDLLRWTFTARAPTRMWGYLAETFDPEFRAMVDREALSDQSPTSNMLKAFLDLQTTRPPQQRSEAGVITSGALDPATTTPGPSLTSC